MSNQEDSLSNEEKNTIKCDQCGMIFMSMLSLENHKEKFCIGIPDSGINRDDFSMDNHQSVYLPQRNNDEIDGSVYPQNYDKISLLKEDDTLSEDENDTLNRTYEKTPRQLVLETPRQIEVETLRTVSKPSIVQQTPRKSNLAKSRENLDKANTVLEDLKNYKSQKEIDQTLKDMEDITIRDTLRDKKLVDSLQDSNSDSQVSFESTSKKVDPYKSLMKEYSELKKKEKKVLQEIFYLKQNDSNEKDVDDADEFLEMLENEMSINKQEFNAISSFPSNPSSRTITTTTSQKTENILKEKQKIQIKEIESKALELEKERRNIELKLENLKATSVIAPSNKNNNNNNSNSDSSFLLPKSSKQSISRILQELRNQEKINEAALQSLRAKFLSEKAIVQAPTYNSKQVTRQTHTNELPSNEMNSDQIRNMRMSYLQKGGHDSSVLKHLGEMEYQTNLSPQAHSQANDFRNDFLSEFDMPLDTTMPISTIGTNSLQYELDMLKRKYQAPYDSNPSNDIVNFIQNRTDYDTHLQQVKMLLNKYDRPVLNTNNYKNDFKLPPIVHQPQQQILSPYMSQRITPNNNFNLSRQSNLSRSQSQKLFVTQAQAQPQPQPQQQQNQPKLKEIQVGPYDPIGGFLVFIDFVSNLNASNVTSRIITCLHHPKSGLGEPSVLPVVNCESYQTNGIQSTIALYSTKQPVPRCPPQQALTILTELQLSIKGDRSAANPSGNPKLKSCAWTKIPLFDARNRLLSGRWKIPLKSLPIQSEMNLSYIKNLEEFGDAELYYRLVNARDSNEQTNEAISPIYASSYTYPPQSVYDNNLHEDSIQSPNQQLKQTSSKLTNKNLNNEKDNAIESAKSTFSKKSLKVSTKR